MESKTNSVDTLLKPPMKMSEREGLAADLRTACFLLATAMTSANQTERQQTPSSYSLSMKKPGWLLLEKHGKLQPVLDKATSMSWSQEEARFPHSFQSSQMRSNKSDYSPNKSSETKGKLRMIEGKSGRTSRTWIKKEKTRGWRGSRRDRRDSRRSRRGSRISLRDSRRRRRGSRISWRDSRRRRNNKLRDNSRKRKELKISLHLQNPEQNGREEGSDTSK